MTEPKNFIEAEEMYRKKQISAENFKKFIPSGLELTKDGWVRVSSSYNRLLDIAEEIFYNQEQKQNIIDVTPDLTTTDLLYINKVIDGWNEPEDETYDDESMDGQKLRVKFFKITNIDGKLYASIKVIRPKRIKYKGQIIDFTRLDDYSKIENGICVGYEQIHKDSLYVSRGKTRTWDKGHVGYFGILNIFTKEQSKEIEKLLCIENTEWDGDWHKWDIL